LNGIPVNKLETRKEPVNFQLWNLNGGYKSNKRQRNSQGGESEGFLEEKFNLFFIWSHTISTLVEYIYIHTLRATLGYKWCIYTSSTINFPLKILLFLSNIKAINISQSLLFDFKENTRKNKEAMEKRRKKSEMCH